MWMRPFSTVQPITQLNRVSTRVFQKQTKLAINPILALEALLQENKKEPIDKILPPVRIELRPLINVWFQVQHSPFWTNLAFACKTETLGSLCNHVLLILTKSSKPKHQVVHEKKFKDILSSTCHISWERRMLDLQSEVQGFNTHWG